MVTGESLLNLCSKWAESWRWPLLAQEHALVDLVHRMITEAVQSQAACAQQCFGSCMAAHAQSLEGSLVNFITQFSTHPTLLCML